VNFLLKYQFCELGNNVCPIQGMRGLYGTVHQVQV